MNRDKIAIIIGAGPAGLSAAYSLLTKTNDIKPIILEELDCNGGISRSIKHEGGTTDIGPHRLFTKNQEVLELWEKLLPTQGAPAIDDKILSRNVSLSENGPDPEKEDKVMLKRRRFSRIYYLRKFFDYPISVKPQTFINLGLGRTLLTGFSYLKSIFVKRKEVSLEDFMINRFGVVLYETFFEKYTTKVWGKHPSEIPKDWGVQRIKGLSLIKILINAILSPFKAITSTNKEVSLIDEYYYPKLGCGQLWDTMAEEIKNMGGEIFYNSKVSQLITTNNKIEKVILENGTEYTADYIISSMPIKDLIAGITSSPEEIKNIAKDLIYRDFILVSLYCSKINLKNNTNHPTINNILPDSWIYMQEDDMITGRLDFMNNFSPYIVKDFQNKLIVNLEYFCNENDDLWIKSDEDMINLGISELEKLNILSKEDVISGMRIPIKKAYPSYFGSYQYFDEIVKYINSIDNLYCIGRNGQHKYNNMDHSILSGLIIAEVLQNKLTKKDLWDVNSEKEYHEVKK